MSRARRLELAARQASWARQHPNHSKDLLEILQYITRMTFGRHALETALNDLIVNRRGIDFQRIAVALARKRCSNLVASEICKDGGTLSDGKTLAVACSITATGTKICDDLARIRSRKPNLGSLWFYTPQGPTTIKTDKWVALAKERFDVELIVFSREEIIGLLLDPDNHYLAHNHLGIPNAVEASHGAGQPMTQNSVGAKRKTHTNMLSVGGFQAARPSVSKVACISSRRRM